MNITFEAICSNAVEAVSRIQDSGHQACLVGGCVRDLLMGKTPHDYDIATSARPDTVHTIFSDCTVADTGLRHGTVTLVLKGEPLEITTFRLESSYSDGRHPDSVTFTGNLEEDLARRDFTMNAIACDPVKRVISDPFGGRDDIERRLIRCVGDPLCRFTEDALRILRCLRFASALGFDVDSRTAKAANEKKALLSHVSFERIYAEFTKLLCGPSAGTVLKTYPDIIFEILPELSPMKGFEQHNVHHCYDVWEHTCAVVDSIPPVPALRWAALLHDSGKPETFQLGQDGTGHFYGHASQSRDIAEGICTRLKFDKATRERVLFIVKRHDTPLEFTEPAFKKYLAKIGQERLRDLIEMAKADNLGQAPAFHYRQATFCQADALLEKIRQSDACLSLKALKINGTDLVAMGMRGKEIGNTLNLVLSKVVQNELPNDRDILLSFLENKMQQA